MNFKYRFVLVLFISIIITTTQAYSQDTLSLQGKWRIILDGNFKDWPTKMGISNEWYKSELPSNNSIELLNGLYFKNANYKLNDWINLPGSTDEAQIGIPLVESEAFTIGLERKISYDGAFWVQRKVNIPESWQGETVYFSMKDYWVEVKFIGTEYLLVKIMDLHFLIKLKSILQSLPVNM